MGNPDALSIRTFVEGDTEAWRRFLAGSATGCLFHDHDFLAYHPADRFRFAHLVAEQAGQITALLPGGLVERDGSVIFRSPLGASFGGPVLGAKARGGEAVELLARLQDFTRARKWDGIDIVPPPSLYRRDSSHVVDFAFPATDFRLVSRLLCHALPLDPLLGGEPFEHLFRGKNGRRARAALKAGVETTIGGIELIDRFGAVFDETYARHGVTPTHSLDEIRDLFGRLPRRFQFAVAAFEGRPLSGLLLIRMSERVANAFYICNSSDQPELNAGLAMFATTLGALARQGIETLDLGPSSRDDGKISGGVAYFKESLGAVAYCRDRWAWNAAV
jgi:Acetyltransferase (GNAT) domain